MWGGRPRPQPTPWSARIFHYPEKTCLLSSDFTKALCLVSFTSRTTRLETASSLPTGPAEIARRICWSR
jgi:hypothetical protein